MNGGEVVWSVTLRTIKFDPSAGLRARRLLVKLAGDE